MVHYLFASKALLRSLGLNINNSQDNEVYENFVKIQMLQFKKMLLKSLEVLKPIFPGLSVSNSIQCYHAIHCTRNQYKMVATNCNWFLKWGKENFNILCPELFWENINTYIIIIITIIIIIISDTVTVQAI